MTLRTATSLGELSARPAAKLDDRPRANWGTRTPPRVCVFCSRILDRQGTAARIDATHYRCRRPCCLVPFTVTPKAAR